MKKIYLYFITIALCLTTDSCKSSQHAGKEHNTTVSKEDFEHSNDHNYGEYKAVTISETVNVISKSSIGAPWENVDYYGISDKMWETTTESKILFLKDDINNEHFTTIDYFSPRDMRWNLMTKCEVWLYDLDNNGSIHKRKAKKNVVTKERLNDSICRMRLNIQENVKGKIMVLKHILLSPYYAKAEPHIVTYSAGVSSYGDYKWAKIKPWIFQREIPLLDAQYKIYLPNESTEVVKKGNGEMNIKHEKKEVRTTLFNRTNNGNGNYKVKSSPGRYDADVITIIVSNVMPLPKESDAQPFGVEFLRHEEMKKWWQK